MPVVKLPDGTKAIVCTGGRKAAPCGFCAKAHTRLCDYPSGKGTCDAKMCEGHATSVGPDRDFCPKHKDSAP